jgi:protein-tyrosine-phosphatase/DNA-binding transcriptional ArsR family regulator
MYRGGVDASIADPAPPEVLRLAGHPLRWRLLTELARSDRHVRELTDLLGRPQNLVSYHLRRLRAGSLVTSSRSSFSGRDSYYSIDLEQVGRLLAGAASALHPGLAVGPAGDPRARASVLFLCTGNSARSQIAQALLEARGGGLHDVSSAGSRPKPLHPNAVRVLRERGIDIAGRRSKSIEELPDRRFDWVISLCDRVREVCPEFPGAHMAHWSVADPALAGATDAETLPAFRETAELLDRRIGFLLANLSSGAAA